MAAPYGLVVTYPTGGALLQIIATTAPGDRYDEPEPIGPHDGRRLADRVDRGEARPAHRHRAKRGERPRPPGPAHRAPPPLSTTPSRANVSG